MNGELESFLSGLAAQGEEILFRPNPGNAGDSLIAHAAYALFRRTGLRWKPATSVPGSGEGRVVVYGGGGNLVRGYTDARAFLEAHSGRCRQLVLLPHTVTENEDLLARLGPEVHLFLRDKMSYDHCVAAAPQARHHEAHDLALGLPPQDAQPVGWLELLRALLEARRCANEPLSRALTMVLLSRIKRGTWSGRARPQGAILQAFRTDSESTGRILPPGNRDLSRMFELGDMSPAWAGLSARLLLTWVEGASLVRTDRLHVTIACCLKGVPVEVHANSTPKVRAVFERSIAGSFPHARWCETPAMGRMTPSDEVSSGPPPITHT